MKNSTKILQARIIRIIDIVILSLFIISLFFPYAGGVVPIEYILGIDSNSPIPDFWFIAIISFPIILSFVLLIFLIFKPWFENQNLKIAKWIIILIFIFIYIRFLIIGLYDWESVGESPSVIYTLVLSLFLFLFTLIMTRNNYLIIGNSILAIITVPVVMSCLNPGPSEIGGYAFGLCFALLYGIAVLKLVCRRFCTSPA
jgi:hypothetical protein